MKKLFVLILAAAAPVAAARVWVSVYQPDGKTPLAAVDTNHPNIYREIMAGTRLTLVIRSDSDEYWAGSLLLSWVDAPYARLSGRGDPVLAPRAVVRTPSYAESSLDAAGTGAVAYDRAGPQGVGLTFVNRITPFLTGGHPAYPGDWFVVDYRARQVGSCEVGLYELLTGGDVLRQTLSFAHVPTRDFNGDGIVNLKDFALLAARWWPAADPNGQGSVGAADLASFSRYWLVRTDSNEPPSPPAPAAKP